jgi:hypothetical protein
MNRDRITNELIFLLAFTAVILFGIFGTPWFQPLRSLILEDVWGSLKGVTAAFWGVLTP